MSVVVATNEQPNEKQVVGFRDFMDGWAALFWGTILAVLFAFGELAYFVGQFQRPAWAEITILVLGIITVALFEGSYLFRLWRAVLQARIHVGPAMFYQERAAGALMRTLKSVWWFAHSAATIAVVVAISTQFVNLDLIAQITLSIIFSFIGAVCANVYLVLGVKAATASNHAAMSVWNRRYIIDLLIGGSCSIAAFLIA